MSMQRRRFLQALGTSAAALSLSPADLLFPGSDALRTHTPADVSAAWTRLRQEAPCRAEVRTERGAPRLFVNNDEVVPLFGLSTSLLPTATNFTQMGIHLLQPIIGMRSVWTGPNTYDFSALDDYFARLLTLDPNAYFFPRVQLNTPIWWKERYPDELIQYGLEHPQSLYDVVSKRNIHASEGGHYFVEFHGELWEASFASERWKEDTAAMLRAYISHVEQSPLASRMTGYFIVHGRTSEWNTFGGDWLPDYSAPMQAAAGPIPTPQERMYTSFGLLRDPAEERAVMDYYRRYHQTVAQTVVDLAAAVKEAMDRRVLCGTFFGYLMENPRMQEGGYLAPQAVLESPDIDLIACPYTYQATNDPDQPRSESDMYDGAGNWLGRARGVAGDGGFRAMLASIRQHGKLYVSEIDPSTYLDRTDGWRAIGGSGTDSKQGTLNVIRRDLGKVYAEGVGGWFFDFGPHHGVETGWYGSPPIIAAAQHIQQLIAAHQSEDLRSVAQIAVVGDTDSFFATKHWLASRPWPGQGIRYSDFINHWFLNAQARTFNRIGAPVDLLHRFDLTADHLRTYRLVFFPNAYLLAREEIDALHTMLRGSGATAVWYYAPGLLTPEGIVPEHMEHLTGFAFDILHDPGPMMIRSTFEEEELRFGVMSPEYYHPRFAVQPADDLEILGRWTRPGRPAFARKPMDGWTSVYVGTAPLPVEWLRRLATEAGATPWTNRPAIVSATRSTAMLVATESGQHTITLPYAMAAEYTSTAQATHTLELDFGEVQLFGTQI